MSLFLSTALFASYAAAQLTTSIWLPGAAGDGIAYVGSVIEQKEDRTILSMAVANPSATDDLLGPQQPATVTVGGETYMAYSATESNLFGEENAAITVSVACERPDTKAVPTCTSSTMGFASVISRLCSASKTETAGTPAEYQEFCTEQSGAPSAGTETLSGDSQYFINLFPLTITAGTEKLSAAATPTASGASSTASGSRLSASNGSPTPSATPTHSGAGAPLKTMAPALAGMGAAVAAFFL